MDDDKALMCDICKKWIHVQCEKMSDILFEHHHINREEIFICRQCRTCGICNRRIATNQNFIHCDLCSNLAHVKCNKFDDKQYKKYLKDENATFCLKCIQENLPFLKLNDEQLLFTMDGIDYPDEIEVNDFFLNESQMSIINKINNLMS